MTELSLLYPAGRKPEYQSLPAETAHDLSIEEIWLSLVKKVKSVFFDKRYIL